MKVCYQNSDLDGTKRWYLDNKLHRIDGPAVEHPNGYKAWYLDGKYHRIDGPAFKGPDGHKEWWINGKLHRTDGPAVEYINGKKEWWVDGNKINFFEIIERLELNIDWTQWTDEDKTIFALAV